MGKTNTKTTKSLLWRSKESRAKQPEKENLPLQYEKLLKDTKHYRFMQKHLLHIYCVPGMCWGLEIWWQRRQSRSPALKEKEAINLRNGIVSAMGA